MNHFSVRAICGHNYINLFFSFNFMQSNLFAIRFQIIICIIYVRVNILVCIGMNDNDDICLPV